MDNEAPKYATWIPEAGGYVANGKVVSKSPIYEADGKSLKVDVDTKTFKNSLQSQPQATQQAVQQSGVATANATDSGKDVNETITSLGSMANLTENTETTGSVLSSPAVDVNTLVNNKPKDTIEEINEGYKDAVARNDIKAEIDWLTKASKVDGIDRTTEIQQLWKERGEKIRAQDNKYLQAIQEAKAYGDATGDYAQYAELLTQQQAYRDSVGYEDQLQRDIQAKEIEQQLDYESAWTNATNDISNAIIQALPGILNFQYDPYADSALQTAQEYTRAVMTEQFANTGMYYSSAVQYAITNAVAQLVPVYEKMAKEEAIENFKLLQSTASYLMNLEEHQFNMWKSQIEMKWKETEQKQKEIDNAINNANARGYYTNEEALLLGISAGTESYEARKRAQDKQDEIEKEIRKFNQDWAMEEFKASLDLEKLVRQSELQAYREMLNDQREFQSKYLLNEQTHAQDMELQALKNKASGTSNTTNPLGKDILTALTNVGVDSNRASKIQELINGDYTETKAVQTMKENMWTTEDYDKAIANLEAGIASWGEELTPEQQEIVDNKDVIIEQIKEEGRKQNKAIASEILEQEAYPKFEEYVIDFGSDYGKTKKAMESLLNEATTYATRLAKTGYDGYEEDVVAMYQHIVDMIEEAPEFDYSWLNEKDEWKELKANAEKDIVKTINSNKWLKDKKSNVAQQVSDYAIAKNAEGETTYRDDVWTRTNVAKDEALNKVTGMVKDYLNTNQGKTFVNQTTGAIGDIGKTVVNPVWGANSALNRSINNIKNSLSNSSK